jgi:hypothetical protein
VNSSTTTGARAVPGVLGDAFEGGRINAIAANREREMRVKPANLCFIGAVSHLPADLISSSAKGYREAGPEIAFLSLTVMIALTGYFNRNGLRFGLL